MIDRSEHFDFTEADDYAIRHSSTEMPVLQKLTRATHLRTHLPQMLSGYAQGLLLQMISRMIKPKNVLEIGTFTGYSAICLAQGLQTDGKLLTIDVNPEMKDFAEPFFAEAGLQEKIRMVCGDALEIIPTLTQSFDLVFIDASKEDYIRYFDFVLPRVVPGGYILADNTLWYGKVLNLQSSDAETQAIRQFNDYLAGCKLVEVLLLPLRDGLTIIRKL